MAAYCHVLCLCIISLCAEAGTHQLLHLVLLLLSCLALILCLLQGVHALGIILLQELGESDE